MVQQCRADDRYPAGVADLWRGSGKPSAARLVEARSIVVRSCRLRRFQLCGPPGRHIAQAPDREPRGIPLAIFGDDGWAGYGGAAAAAYRGGPVPLMKQRNYASGAIALNLHHPHFERGTSLRTFALCCSGAFQLADWREGIDRWLTPGLEIEVFRTPGQLRALVERYLGDHPARARIAAAGRARVIAEHTYFHRLAKMLEVLPAVSAA